jgi:acetyltransferase-like isoleucine patch superfamily enzyme
LYEGAEINNFQDDDRKIIVGEETHIRAELLIFKYGGEIIIGDNCYVGKGTNI